MAIAAPGLRFETDFDPRTGELVAIAEGIARVTAPNPGPFTFTGTNTYLLGDMPVIVVDPGPALPAHLSAVLDAIAGRPVEAIVLTHTHKDHSALARRMAACTGAPIWFGGRHRALRPSDTRANPVRHEADWKLVPDRILRDGERFGLGPLAIDVYGTPGHCANHLSFGLLGTPYLLSGDHVMGWNSTMVPPVDGAMTEYLASLEKLIAAPYATYLPGHGGPIADGPEYARALLAHRRLRNAQILEQVGRRPRTLGQLVAEIYRGLPAIRLPAARMTLRAHLDHLVETGAVRPRRSPLGRLRYGLA